jgi:hypothetical protein
MTIYREYRVGGNSPFSFLGPLIILALVFGVLFFVARGIFWLLSWAAPVLILLTLVMDYKVVTDYFKMMWKTSHENILLGLLLLVITVVGYPFVSGYLFFKALARRSSKKSAWQQQSGKDVYTDFEEVVEDKDFLELPELKPQKQTRQSSERNSYDDVF